MLEVKKISVSDSKYHFNSKQSMCDLIFQATAAFNPAALLLILTCVLVNHYFVHITCINRVQKYAPFSGGFLLD